MKLSISEFIRSEWVRLNRRYFGGQLAQPEKFYVVKDIPGAVRLGAFCTHREHAHDIGLGAYLFDYPGNVGSARFASDYLLHEMAHAAAGLPDPGEDAHDSPAWIGQIKRITPLLGLPIQTTFNRFQRRSWPHSITATAFYRGAAQRLPGATVYFRGMERYLFGLEPTPMRWKMALDKAAFLTIQDVNAGGDGGIVDIRFNPRGDIVVLSRE